MVAANSVQASLANSRVIPRISSSSAAVKARPQNVRPSPMVIGIVSATCSMQVSRLTLPESSAKVQRNLRGGYQKCTNSRDRPPGLSSPILQRRKGQAGRPALRPRHVYHCLESFVDSRALALDV